MHMKDYYVPLLDRPKDRRQPPRKIQKTDRAAKNFSTNPQRYSVSIPVDADQS